MTDLIKSNLTASLVITALALFLLPHSLLQGSILDEDQFVAAAYLIGDHLIYRDFVYFQPPVYPLALAALGWMLDEPHLFFLARMTSWALASGCLVLMFLIGRMLTGRQTIAIGLAVLFALSPLLMASFASARNDIMPIFLGLLGVTLTLAAFQKNRGESLLFLLSGIALALAVGTKLSAAFVPLVVTGYIVLRRDGRSTAAHLRLRLLPLVAGGVIGALPILYYALRTPDNFLYDVFLFHLSDAPARWYRFLGRAEELEASQISHVILSILFQDPAMLAAFVVLLLALGSVLGGRRWGSLHRRLSERQGYLILGLLIAALVLSIQPTPHLVHYFMPIAPYLLLTGGILLDWLLVQHLDLERSAPQRRGAGLAVILLLIALAMPPQVRDLAQKATRVHETDAWVALRVRRVAETVKKRLQDEDIEGPVASLNPLYVMEAGLPLLPAFASSIFLYRTGDQDDPEVIRRVRGIAPSLLDEILGETPPAAILIGQEFDSLAQPLIDWAKKEGYREVESPGRTAGQIADQPLRLFLR